MAMSADLTDQLRAGIVRVPAQVPPGLARNAYRRYRKRRLVARVIAAVGTAAVAIIAAAVALSGSSKPAGPGMQTTAYVVSHVTQALDALPANTVLFDRTTYDPPGSGPGSNQPQDTWETPGRSRTMVFTQAGQLEYDNADLLTRTTYKVVAIYYPNKAWSELTNSNGYGTAQPRATNAFTCGEDGADIILMPSAGQFAAWLRAEVSCGQVKAAGTGTIDGATALKLTAGKPQSTITYWVDPTTYLPVHVTVNRGPGTQIMQQALQWLPPAPANLAKLNFPAPPAGFVHVPWNGCLSGCTP
jgi:hypothetical protein